LSDVVITVRPNGPYLISGPVSIVDADGGTFPPRDRVALCRCGASVTKPYCDGTHSKMGFDAATKAVAEAEGSGG